MTSLLPRYISALRACGLQPADRVAVALSGGPDSLALASMTVWWQGYVRNQVRRWLGSLPGCRMHRCRSLLLLAAHLSWHSPRPLASPAQQPPLALIVDHRLRPESSEEAHAVAEQAAALGMQTRVLTVEWPGGELPSTGDTQQAARDARYALLLRACGELGRSHLLLGHHAGDQAETFLLRLKHASGVAGLACMPRVAEKRTGAPPQQRVHWLPAALARLAVAPAHPTLLPPLLPPATPDAQTLAACSCCARCWASQRRSWRATASGAGCSMCETQPTPSWPTRGAALRRLPLRSRPLPQPL